MHPPLNAVIVETPIFDMWLDEAGVLYFVSKKHPPQTLEESQSLFDEIKKISGRQKRCMLMDLTCFQMPSRESRAYGAVELPSMVTAIAFLSGSALGTFVANAFFSIWRQPYPTKMFNDEEKAKEWLKQYL